MQQWKNYPGEVQINLNRDDCPSFLEQYMTEEEMTLAIEFTSSGFYSPMAMYGGPNNLGHPEEYEDERILKRASLDKTELPTGVAKETFQFYEQQVYEVNLGVL